MLIKSELPTSRLFFFSSQGYGAERASSLSVAPTFCLLFLRSREEFLGRRKHGFVILRWVIRGEGASVAICDQEPSGRVVTRPVHGGAEFAVAIWFLLAGYAVPPGVFSPSTLLSLYARSFCLGRVAYSTAFNRVWRLLLTHLSLFHFATTLR